MASSVTPVYGNYHGYYSKRPSVRDPRLSLLPPSFFTGKTVLDIGCNEGWVTCEIGQIWGAARVVGVDIDETLIRGAWKRRRSLWSQQFPGRDVIERKEDNNSSGVFKRAKLDGDTDSHSFDYFPASCEHSNEPLPIPTDTTKESYFPTNVIFRTADWLTEPVSERYDIVIALSITKWIHLNYGDDGIRRFFRKVHGSLNAGGFFVLEPQTWETYAKAKRMDEKLKENAKHLKLHPDNFPTIMQDIGFGPPQHLGSVGEGGFHRPVDIYIRL
ncbi:Bicoid-interacting protein 3-domain-containing protein [Pisolithus marmoratus]|nr:Bicoid-interacting protein 3-domain-containing protein [Pisolithus marmoratus]